jgi:hypothetical protein
MQENAVTQIVLVRIVTAVTTALAKIANNKDQLSSSEWLSAIAGPFTFPASCTISAR